jgi:PAS domain S-box-containing protein
MVELRLFGSVSVSSPGGGELRPLVAQRKPLSCLVFCLLASPRGVLDRETLLGVFWPELTQQRARTALRKSLHVLRHALPRGAILGDGDEQVGVNTRLVWCDALEFRRALSQGALLQAMKLYHGDLLPGWVIVGAPEFDRWLEHQRADLRHSAAAAALTLSEADHTAGNLRGAVLWARRSVQLTPESEGGVQWLMYLQTRSGDRAGAAATFARFERELDQVYGLEPSADTRSMLAGSPRLEGYGAAGAELVDPSVPRGEADLYRELVEESTDLIFRIAPDGRLSFLNRAGAVASAISRRRLLGCRVIGLVPKEYRAGVRDFMTQLSGAAADTFSCEVPVMGGGKVVWLSLNLRRMVLPSGELVYQGIGRDVTAQKRAEGALRHLAIVDSETKLYNRRALILLTSERMKLARRSRIPLLLFAARVHVDSNGHSEQASTLAAWIGGLLRDTFRESDLLARVSEETFVVIATRDREDAAEAIDARFRSRISAAAARGGWGQSLQVSSCVVALAPESRQAFSEQLRAVERRVASPPLLVR